MLTPLDISVLPTSFAEVSPYFVTGTRDLPSDLGLGAHSCATMADMLSAPYNLNAEASARIERDAAHNCIEFEGEFVCQPMLWEVNVDVPFGRVWVLDQYLE
jgi:hypothetical protein